MWQWVESPLLLLIYCLGDVISMESPAKRNKLDVDNGETIPDDDIQSLILASSMATRKRKKKSKRKRKSRDAEIDGCRIAGLEKTDTYNPGSEDEEDSNTARQDDHILKKLLKKSGKQYKTQDCGCYVTL